MGVKVKFFSLIIFVCLLVASLSVGVWALTTIDEFNVQGNMSYEGIDEGYNNPVLMSDTPLTFEDGDEAGTKIISGSTDSTLTSINLPSYVTDGTTTYKVVGIKSLGTSQITSLVIPKTIKSISMSACYGYQKLKTLTFEEGSQCETIGMAAFYRCTSLQFLDLPSSVKTIGHNAFALSTSLKHLNLPEGLETIEGASFNLNNAISLHIPSTLTSIGSSAFGQLISPTSITVSPYNPVYDSRNDCNAIIETATNTLLYGCKTTVIPSTVKTIGDGAFRQQTELTEIIVPDSVTEIGRGAFGLCSKLHRITLPFVGGGYFQSKFLGYIFGASSATDQNSSIPSSLKEVVITNQGDVPENAFYGCSNIVSIRYEHDVEGWAGYAGEVESYAFSGCTSLKLLYLGIGFCDGRFCSSAVSGCSSLAYLIMDVIYISYVSEQDNPLYEGSVAPVLYAYMVGNLVDNWPQFSMSNWDFGHSDYYC